MQKAGRKSIVVETLIPNSRNPQSPFMVKVQANKNHGICNIVTPLHHAGDILSSFQGRQYDDPDVFGLLEVALEDLLNSSEL